MTEFVILIAALVVAWGWALVTYLPTIKKEDSDGE